MTVEITDVDVEQGVVSITAVDCSEENLQRLERLRDDGQEVEVKFMFDTHERYDYMYLLRWLRNQKITKSAKTWGEALRSVCGTVTSISNKYRVWE